MSQSSSSVKPAARARFRVSCVCLTLDGLLPNNRAMGCRASMISAVPRFSPFSRQKRSRAGRQIQFVGEQHDFVGEQHDFVGKQYEFVGQQYEFVGGQYGFVGQQIEFVDRKNGFFPRHNVLAIPFLSTSYN
jgi:hypothetical protein